MALVVNTNIASLNAQRQLNSTTNEMSTAMERLSSGKRINSAADDSAGLAISTRMTSQVKGLTAAIRNANDGISIVQTAEGALDEVTDMLQRMRELAVQAASGSNSAADLTSLDSEVSDLLDEIDRVATTTRFNNINILDGSYGVDLQIGDQADQTLGLSIADMSTSAMGETASGLGTAATSASVSTSGSNDSADYLGRSILVGDGSTTATVSISANASADAVAASATASLVGDDYGDATSRVISTVAYEQNTVDMTGAANRVLQVRVKDSGFVNVDFSDALATQLGLTVAQLEDGTNFDGDIVKAADLMAAMQSALDENFSGDYAVTVSVNEFGAIEFADSDGRIDRIALREGVASDSTAGTFVQTFVDEDITGVRATNLIGQGSSSSTVDMGIDDVSVFKVKVNGASTYTTVDFLDKLNDASIVKDRDQMFAYELVDAIQAELDELFTGDDAVTVGFAANGQLTFSVAGGDRTLEFAEGTYTATDGTATAATFVQEFISNNATPTVSNKTSSLDLSSFNSLDLSDMSRAFQEDDFAINVRVNGGTATDIDLAPYLQANVADYDSISGEEIASALQAAFNDTFTGDDAITVTMRYDGVLDFDVAGGAQVLEIHEADVDADGTYGTFASNFIDSSISTAATSFIVNENILGATTVGDVDYGGYVSATATLVTNIANTLEDSATTEYEIAAGGGARVTPFAVDDLNSAFATADTTATAGLTVTAANDAIGIALDDATAVTVTVDAGEYATLEAYAASLQYEIDASGQFDGENALTVGVEYYTNGSTATSEADGAVARLVLSSEFGKKIELSGEATTSTTVNGFAFFGDELDTAIDATYMFQELGISPDDTLYRTHDRVDGGIDTTAGSGIVNLSVVQGGSTYSYALTLDQDANTSFDDFASDLQAKANAAFVAQGLTFTASNNDGTLTFAMDDAGAATFSLSGTIMDNALGGELSGTGYEAGVTSMSDVVSAVNSELANAGVNVSASYSEDSSAWTFESTATGSAAQVTVSGSDLSQLSMTAGSANGTDSTATAGVLSDVSVASADAASNALASIDNAIEYISAQRADLGATENRLTHTINNLSNVVENTSAARSRIEDADYAVEAANLAKMQVMQQAGTAMLAQANAQAQIVLSLLG